MPTPAPADGPLVSSHTSSPNHAHGRHCAYCPLPLTESPNIATTIRPRTPGPGRHSALGVSLGLRSGKANRSPILSALPAALGVGTPARDGMFGMGSEQNDDLFLMTVDEVFGLTAVDWAVLGPIQPGEVRSGDFVEVVRGQEAVATAHVVRENITEKRALILRDLIASLPKPGDTIRVRRS